MFWPIEATNGVISKSSGLITIRAESLVFTATSFDTNEELSSEINDNFT